MLSLISRFSNWTTARLESSLLPLPVISIKKKPLRYSFQLFQFILFFPLAATSSFLVFGLKRAFFKKPLDPPLLAFAKYPEWKETVKRAPVQIGFATADFQDNGPIEHSQTNWADFYQRHHFDPGTYLPDSWNHPERVIERLKELGVRHFRFSISRDKIEPTKGEAFHQPSLDRYCKFCNRLKLSGIEPLATLHHFTHPSYFTWERAEDIDGFVRYAIKAAEALYEAGIRKIVTLNEPNVSAFQGWILGSFPPQKVLDFTGAARTLHHMMQAHTQIYKELKSKYPALEIGITHDPIRFRNYHKWHPLWTPVEKIICHYLTEITHKTLLRFLYTGKFSLRVPLKANYEFSLPQPPLLDFIGLQYYTDPLIKFSFKGGESVSRCGEEKLASYQYRAYPQGLASALEELRNLAIPIDLTEIGIDTGINFDHSDKERIQYFERIFQVVEKALNEGISVRSLYFWTLIDNLEWHQMWKVRFGFYQFDSTTNQITPRPVAEWLKKLLLTP